FMMKWSTITSCDFNFKVLALLLPYSVRVQFIGYGEQIRTGYTLNQADVVRSSVKMADSSQNLDAVEITAATGLKDKIENRGAATAVSAKDVTRLPVNGRNFTSLTDLSPLAS